MKREGKKRKENNENEVVLDECKNEKEKEKIERNKTRVVIGGKWKEGKMRKETNMKEVVLDEWKNEKEKEKIEKCKTKVVMDERWKEKEK